MRQAFVSCYTTMQSSRTDNKVCNASYISLINSPWWFILSEALETSKAHIYYRWRRSDQQQLKLNEIKAKLRRYYIPTSALFFHSLHIVLLSTWSSLITLTSHLKISFILILFCGTVNCLIYLHGRSDDCSKRHTFTYIKLNCIRISTFLILRKLKTHLFYCSFPS